MKMANISTIKNKLSQYLDHVRRGGTVRIFDRNVPVADIIPVKRDVEDAKDASKAWLSSLEAKGIVKRGTLKLARELFDPPTSFHKESGGHGVLEALLKERDEGR